LPPASTTKGAREILGVIDSESATGWQAFFSRLKERGLAGVDVAVSDSHSGMVKALLAHFRAARGSGQKKPTIT
jgi:putative transposase